MVRISDTEKDEIRNRLPIEELIRDYNVALRPSGKRLVGLCPFHAEKTPSFSVDVERQYYHCFGCQASGDLFSFVQQMDHLEFPEAAELLARRAGVILKGDPYADRGSRERRLAMYDALKFAAALYHRQLMESAPARGVRDYLGQRGIAPESWKTFELGYSPPDGRSLMESAKERNISLDVLEKAGLVRTDVRRGYTCDMFRGRLMFPITDSSGRPIGFGARTLGDDVPKYLNTPKTILFDKSQVLYGLSAARGEIHREGVIGVMEGYTDVIMAHQVGLKYFVASLGTAFTAENARRLGRLASKAVLVFDGDEAGQSAAEKSIDLLVGEEVDVKVYSVSGGKDPCEALASEGPEVFRERLAKDSEGALHFKWRRTIESAPDPSPVLKARALDEFLSLLARVPNQIAQKLYIKEFSERLDLSERDFERRLKKVMQRRGGRSVGATQPRNGGQTRVGGSSVDRGGVDRGGVDRSKGQPEIPVGSGMRSNNGSTDPGSHELARVVLECVLALPYDAAAIWSEVPKELFQDAALAELANSIERQLRGGGLSPDRLVHEVDHPEAKCQLLELLTRSQTDDGTPAVDYQEKWQFAQRDLGRFLSRRQVHELRKAIATADERGDLKRVRDLRHEYFRVLRRVKSERP